MKLVNAKTNDYQTDLIIERLKTEACSINIQFNNNASSFEEQPNHVSLKLKKEQDEYIKKEADEAVKRRDFDVIQKKKVREQLEEWGIPIPVIFTQSIRSTPIKDTSIKGNNPKNAYNYVYKSSLYSGFEYRTGKYPQWLLTEMKYFKVNIIDKKACAEYIREKSVYVGD